MLSTRWCSKRQWRYYCQSDNAPSISGVTNRTGKGEGKWTTRGTARFVWFASQTVGSNGPISVRLLSNPIGWTEPEPWPADPVRFLKPWFWVPNLKKYKKMNFNFYKSVLSACTFIIISWNTLLFENIK